MSISLNNAINTSLPVSDVRSSSVIKKSATPEKAPAKADFSAMVNGAQEPASVEIVTAEEKQFFASMFPKATDAIQSYAGYSPAGAKKPVQLGMHIDIKG